MQRTACRLLRDGYIPRILQAPSLFCKYLSELELLIACAVHAYD